MSFFYYLDPPALTKNFRSGGKSNPIDLTTVYPSIPDQTTIFLGCTILHVSTPQKDAKNPKTFTTGSSNTAKGAFNGEGADGRFYVDPGPNVMNALQASDLRLTDTTPAVAKLLVALANLIAPEVTV